MDLYVISFKSQDGLKGVIRFSDTESLFTRLGKALDENATGISVTDNELLTVKSIEAAIPRPLKVVIDVNDKTVPQMWRTGHNLQWLPLDAVLAAQAASEERMKATAPNELSDEAQSLSGPPSAPPVNYKKPVRRKVGLPTSAGRTELPSAAVSETIDAE